MESCQQPFLEHIEWVAKEGQLGKWVVEHWIQEDRRWGRVKKARTREVNGWEETAKRSSGEPYKYQPAASVVGYLQPGWSHFHSSKCHLCNVLVCYKLSFMGSWWGIPCSLAAGLDTHWLRSCHISASRTLLIRLLFLICHNSFCLFSYLTLSFSASSSRSLSIPHFVSPVFFLLPSLHSLRIVCRHIVKQLSWKSIMSF